MVEIHALFIELRFIDQGNANSVWPDYSHTAGPADSVHHKLFQV